MTKISQRQASPVQHRTVEPEHTGQRLDNYLFRELRGVPRTRLYRALRKGEVRVNKKRVKADYRLQAGDIVRLPPLVQAEAREAGKAPARLLDDLAHRVVYEDAGLLVIDKPSGLAVHGGSGLSFGLIESLRQARPDERYLELVHRLDRDTSGLILVARKPAVLKELHRQLRGDGVDKRYLALVAGRWPRNLHQVEAPLEKNVLQSGERMVRVSKEGKRSLTRFTVIERLPGATLLEAKPITGRTHQIRVHARHAGCPLLGDAKYASEAGEQLAVKLGLGRLFLHATALDFKLLDAGTLRLRAGLPADLEKALNKLRNSPK